MYSIRRRIIVQGQQRASSHRHLLNFIRGVRTRVQQLLRTYKEQQLGDQHFEDRELELSSLPSLSTDFHSWLQVTDWERLSAASRDLHTYWAHLDRKIRQQGMERPVSGSKHKNNTPPTLPERFDRIQTDLSDLIEQVNTQLRSVSSPSVSPTSPPASTHSPTPPSAAPPPRQTEWTSRMEGYVILRDLERYLLKLSRDFLLLASTQNNNLDKA